MRHPMTVSGVSLGKLRNGRPGGRGVLRGGRDALQLVKPSDRAGVRVGEEEAGEQLTKCRHVATPSLKDQGARRSERLLPFLGISKWRPGKGAVQDQAAHALRVANSVGDGGGSTLGPRKECASPQFKGIDHRLQISYPGIQAEVIDVTVG